MAEISRAVRRLSAKEIDDGAKVEAATRMDTLEIASDFGMLLTTDHKSEEYGHTVAALGAILHSLLKAGTPNEQIPITDLDERSFLVGSVSTLLDVGNAFSGRRQRNEERARAYEERAPYREAFLSRVRSTPGVLPLDLVKDDVIEALGINREDEASLSEARDALSKSMIDLLKENSIRLDNLVDSRASPGSAPNYVVSIVEPALSVD